MNSAVQLLAVGPNRADRSHSICATELCSVQKGRPCLPLLLAGSRTTDKALQPARVVVHKAGRLELKEMKFCVKRAKTNALKQAMR